MKMNVILIVVDALRPDHLSANGYSRATSPNIDKISKEGAVFLNSYTVLPRTNAAMASIFTGLYPHSHGVRLISNKKMRGNAATLAEILKSHGYKTAFIRSGGMPYDGTEKGFDNYNMLKWRIINKVKRVLYKTFHPNNFIGVAQQSIETAIKWINVNLNKNFFLVIHTNDLHWPYNIPAPYDHMFDPEYKGNHDFDTLKSNKHTRGEIIFGHADLPKEEIDHAAAHYDGGIKYVDGQIGKFFDFLRKKEIIDNTLIIICSDHGEHFGDHDFYFQHGYSLYESSIKSTLIMYNPGIIPKRKAIESKVQILDIMPTILDILDIPLIDCIDGFSLLPLLRGEKDKARDFVFAESAEEHIKGNPRVFFEGNKGKWRAILIGDWKLIYIPHPDKDIFELYNLKNDPHEKHNLIEEEKKIALDMQKKILEFLKAQDNEGTADLSDLKERSKKLLRQMGYIE